jgi:ABC-type sugar transport system substrate-binding protein
MKTGVGIATIGFAAVLMSSTAGWAQDKLDISLLNAFVADEFWQGCSVGAKRAAEEVGATITGA